MSDCEPPEKRQRPLESGGRPEDAENQRTEAVRPEGSSKLQRKRQIPGKSRQKSLDLWLQKPSVTRKSSAHTVLSTSPERDPASIQPTRAGSDPEARTSRAAAGTDGKALSSDVISQGVALADLRRAPTCSGSLPALRPANEHTVMIRTERLDPEEVPVPFPETRSDCWDDYHVKLPCSQDNLFPVDRTTLQSRWDLITRSLSVPFTSSLDVQDAILRYNAGQAKAWSFTALHSYCTDLQGSEAEQMFGKLFPAMAQLAMRAPSLFTQPIPLLSAQRCGSITLSQEQVSCLLANAFFCTFPRRNSRRTEFSNYPDINFNRLFEGSSPSKQQKLKTLLCYFKRITQRRPTGLITYTRQCLQRLPPWSSSEKQFSKLHIRCDGTIEEQGYGMLQVDFANRFVGGGVTGSGLVQEEIRFLINPELIAARLFTEALEDNECLIITGTEQFSRYSGYSHTYRWDGNHDDQTPRDNWQRRVTEVVAIDALHYRNFLQQFLPDNMTRELNKAFCGFARPGVEPENLSAVATGNWGCGAFGGDTRLKAVLQMMAAAEAERDLMYFTFGDADLLRDVHRIHKHFTHHHASVGSVFNMLQQYYERVIKETPRAKPQETLYSFLSEHL
ncbi:hypothetical protein R3I93_018329 [Phoxinus phoxinus]|uniref:poly(ADP-ribose) glycohydrolase n=1 Tax=Phoxinus phoxinus TaxID=58324 RepID=A0AAN9CG45_9TELE